MFELYPFFVLRRSALSLNRLDCFYQQVKTGSLAEALRHYYQDDFTQAALQVASPALFERFSRWLSGDSLPEEKKLLATLHKYAIRMCCRPTPYGLFAGISLGEFAQSTHLMASSGDIYRSHARLDHECLRSICNWLTQQPHIKPHLRLHPNTSLYQIGTSLRYVEQHVNEQQYFISAVEVDQYLERALSAVQPDGLLTSQLVSQFTEVPREEAERYIEQLIEGQLLHFETEPAVTNAQFLSRLLSRLIECSPTTTSLVSLQTLIECFSQNLSISTLHQQTQHWLTDQEIQPATPERVHVDLYVDTPKLTLGLSAVKQLQLDLQKILVLNQPAVLSDLDSFKRRFVNRYEEEEIPLSLALDSEFGVGYGSATTQGVGYAPLVDDLVSQTLLPVASNDDVSKGAGDWWQQFILDKYAAALRISQHEITLTDSDLADIARHNNKQVVYPYSGYALGSLLAKSEKALDNGDFSFTLLACHGPSSMNLLSRFGEGNEQLMGLLRRCASAEEAHQSNAVIAEIVHLPANRAGNILARPALYRYEIPYLGRASVGMSHQIPITDLLVSVRNGQVILRSKRLNRRVIPRLTSAHNYKEGLPTYRFLCDLQAQDGYLNVRWNWGTLEHQAYLPRVRYNRIIVHRATWQLTCAVLSADNPLKLVAQLTAAGLPERFVLAQADNELLIHLHIPASLELLAQAVRKYEQIKLIEWLPNSDQCPVKRRKDAYTHELVLPFSIPTAPTLLGTDQLSFSGVKRRFSIGSEWFYIKLYVGEKATDILLAEAIHPVVLQLLNTQIIDAFFFVRYQDSDSHLRLRFLGNPHVDFYQYVVRAIKRVLQESIKSGIVHRVQVDTYQREIERYGVDQMINFERLFCYDSLSTLTLLAQTNGLFNEELRFAVAIAKTRQILIDSGLSISQQYNLLDQLKESFFEEFGGDSTLRQQLNDKYRLYMPILIYAMKDDFQPVDGIWQWRSEQRKILKGLEINVESSELGQHSFRQLGSLIHMVVNRLFPTKQRFYELVLYHCLAKYYRSTVSRVLS